MYKIHTYNQISTKGLNCFSRDHYEIASELTDPDALMLRSHELNNADISSNVQAIARCGTGVNNIPVPECSKKGVVLASRCFEANFGLNLVAKTYQTTGPF